MSLYLEREVRKAAVIQPHHAGRTPPAGAAPATSPSGGAKEPGAAAAAPGAAAAAKPSPFATPVGVGAAYDSGNTYGMVRWPGYRWDAHGVSLAARVKRCPTRCTALVLPRAGRRSNIALLHGLMVPCAMVLRLPKQDISMSPADYEAFTQHMMQQQQQAGGGGANQGAWSGGMGGVGGFDSGVGGDDGLGSGGGDDDGGGSDGGGGGGDEDPERARERREKNRIAARKCRAKKVAMVRHMQVGSDAVAWQRL